MSLDLVAQVDSAEDSIQNGPKKPFWSLDFENEEELLSWLNTELEHLKNQATDRHLNQRKNLASYRGIRLSTTDKKGRDESASESTPGTKNKNPRTIYNHMVDMVEQDVSRMTEYRGAVEAEPTSDDNEDRVTAEISEELVEKFWDKVDIDEYMTMHSRRKRIFGEDFLWVVWNKNLGPYDPEWLTQAFKKAGITEDPRKMKRGEIRNIMRKKMKEIPRLPLLGEDGKQMTADGGEPLWIDKPMRLGDVEYRLWFSWNMFLQRKDTYKEVEYGFGTERVKLHTVQAQHPKSAGKITADPNSNVYDAETCDDSARNDECEVIHFHHRSTDELDQGRYIKFTRTAILRNKPGEYIGQDDKAIFPWVRTLDIDTPAVLNGDASVTHGRGPQTVYNNLVSMKLRNRFLFSHPKWMVPAKSVKIESLANNTTVVSYKGPVPPSLSQPAINESNESQMMQEAKGDMQQIMGVYGISRGEPPKGVTAAVAMTYLDDQENKRANPGVQVHTRTLKEVAKRTLWLMSDHYEDQEGRLESLLGRNRSAQLTEFKFASLRDSGDLKIQNTTALPHQKSHRLQMIMDIKKEFPGIMPDDTAIDLLGLGDVDRMRNVITVAIRKAEGETGRMMNGAKVPDPLAFEYHLAHYRVHVRQMNELAYNKLPKTTQNEFEKHIAGHEYHMVEAGGKNPQYLQLVMQEFPGFPYFYFPEEMAAPLDVEGSDVPPPPGAMPPTGPGRPMPSMAQSPEAMPPGAGLETPPPEVMPPGAESFIPPQGA